MKPEDLIFKEVYQGAMKQGAPERQSKDSAIQAMKNYKRSNFKGG